MTSRRPEPMTAVRAVCLALMALDFVADAEPDAPPDWQQAAELLREVLAELRGPSEEWFYSGGRPWGWKAIEKRKGRKVGEFK